MPTPAETATGKLSRQARLTMMAVLLATLVGCDQVSKRYATEHLRHTAVQPLTYCGDVVKIHYALNPGAFLSLFSNLSDQTRFWLLTVMNSVILGGLAVLLIARPDIDRLTFWALALILAGGLGNLIDRLFLGGHVIDFMMLDFTWTGIHWLRTGVFNVADMAITAGFLMLLPHFLGGDRKPRTTPETA